MKLEHTLQDKCWQKICVAEDWHHPDFEFVLNNIFKRIPSYHRKQWEFIVIFLNLMKQNKLHDQSVGASFGAGREPLIFNVLPYVKHFTATDLYSLNTGWLTAKLDDQQNPKEFVVGACPEGMDHSHLDVMEMDMRTIGFDDNSLDFCYSSCAFEHIGHDKDFIQHLKEVKRVLKDDGVYVMTTEHLFLHETIPTKGNYKFDLDYLENLFKQAGLYPEKDFDSVINRSYLNNVRPPVQALAGFSAGMINGYPGVILEKQGVPYTSSCFVLSKREPTQLQVSGAEKAAQYVEKNVQANIRKIYSHYQYLNPVLSLNKKFRTAMSDHLEYIVDQADEHFDAIKINTRNFGFTDFIYFHRHTIRITIDVELNKKNKIAFKLIEKPQLGIKGRKVKAKETHKFSGSKTVQFDFKARKDRVYAIILAKGGLSDVNISNLTIRAKIVAQ